MATGDHRAHRPLRRDAEANREKILIAADQLFAERGLQVGHDEVARAAGVAVGTVYRRFPDKASLVTALYTDRIERAVAAAEAALLVEDPWTGLVQFLTTILQMQETSRGLGELSAGNPNGHELARRAREHIAPVVTRLVERGHAAGVLRPEIREQDIALIPIMIGAVIRAAHDVDPDLWRRALRIVLDGLHAQPHPPLPGSAPSGADITSIIGRQAPEPPI